MKRLLSIFVLVLLVISNVSAQELTESYVFENAMLEIYFPDNWEIVVDEDDFISLETTDTSFLPGWYFPDSYEELDIEAGDIESVFRASTDHLDDHNFDDDAITSETVDDVELFLYPYQSETDGETYEVVKIARELPDEVGYFIATVFPIRDEDLDDDDYEDALRMVANVVDVQDEDSGSNGGPSGAGDGGGNDDDDNDPAGGFDETYTFEDFNVVVSHSSDWDLTENENGTLSLTTEDTYIDVIVYDEDELEDENIDEGDLAGVIEVFFDRFNIEFDEDAVEMTEVDDVEVAVAQYFYETEDSEYNGQVIVRELPDGTIVVIDVYPRRGDDVNEDDLDSAFEVSAALDND